MKAFCKLSNNSVCECIHVPITTWCHLHYKEIVCVTPRRVGAEDFSKSATQFWSSSPVTLCVGGDCGRQGKGKSVCGDTSPAAGGLSTPPVVAEGRTNETHQWAKTGKVKLRNWQPLLKSREGTRQGLDLVRAISCKLKSDFYTYICPATTSPGPAPS